jgi:hypothetical protein
METSQVKTDIEKYVEQVKKEAYELGFKEGKQSALKEILDHLQPNKVGQQIEMEIEKGEQPNGERETTSGQPSGTNINFG